MGYIPFPHGTTVKVFQGNGGPGTHHCPGYDCYAWDFGNPNGNSQGMQIVAATRGTVTGFRNDYQGTCSDFYSGCAFGNYVFVKNSDGTYVEYLHMEPGSVVVHVGQQVSIGDKIGKIGATGYTGGFAHLHFSWLSRASGTGNNPSVAPSIPGTFIGIGNPVENQVLTSNNPGSGGTFTNSYELAFQANTGSLWSVGADMHGAWNLGMMRGTSPAVAALPSGGYEYAFQSNAGELWSVGADTHGDWHLGMMRYTSPSIAGLPGGGYEIAFQANTGDLYTIGGAGATGHGDWHLGMMAGTSPAVAALAGGGYEVAFQANTGELYTIGSDMHRDWHLQMAPGTSPAITALPNGGYEVAFQAPSGDLYTTGSDQHGDWYLGLRAGTSPSIATLSTGQYEVAFQSNAGSLWSTGADRHGDWQAGMMANTSPSIVPLASGAYELAFEANTGSLWSIGGDPHGDWHDGMMLGTSPSAASGGSSGSSPGSDLPPPASGAPPAITGSDRVGDTLVLHHGVWSNQPTRYGEQWLRCDRAGSNCIAIAGAGGTAYTLTAQDAGRTIRVQEWAANATASAGPVTSAPTAVVAAKPPPPPPPACVVPHLVHLTLSQAYVKLRRAHCRLGKVHRPRHPRRHHTLHVVWQSPRPGTRHRNGYKVAVVVR